ncbi:FAD-dependent oxidoreductase [Burkholderia stagnalis]|nr:FAD-dependent oxidoreductase [Burkholderia stagnalis]
MLFGLPGDAPALAQAVAGLALPVKPVLVVPRGQAQAVQGAPGVDVLEDVDGLAAQRYDAKPGTFYLLRPDQHVCARMRALDRQAVGDALARATCAA